ncbi:MAG TPA: transglutaminase domain-containing protein [Caldilineae bacterium]|nr:transglutaminase domain-containing protein [Caldilineae bacterium]
MTTLTDFPAAASGHAVQTRRAFIRPWVDFLLLAFMIANLAWSIHAANWSPGLDRIFPVVSVALVAGTLVALSDFRHLFSLVYSLVVGAAAILWSMASLAPEGLVGQESVFYVVKRTIMWAYSAFIGEPVADNLVFVLLMCILMWILTYGATWSYFREGRKWQAILPTGLAMLVNLYYGPPHLNGYFVIYLLTAILLLVRATLADREVEWRSARVRFPFDISFDFMRDGILFAIFVIFTSWILPSAANDGQINPILEPLQGPWQDFKQEWDRLFSTVNYNTGDNARAFGTALALGGPREVTDEIVMDVDTPVDRYYRAVFMDTYLQGGWFLGQSEGVRLGDDSDFEVPTWSNRKTITQTITVYQPGNVLVAAPQPIKAMLPADAEIVTVPIENSGAADEERREAELAMVVSRKSQSEGDSYVVVSSIPDVTEAQLKAASTVYPDHITARYLQIPDTVPQRVFDLADEVTAGLDNPYDIAKTLERFLRGYKYNDQIPGPKPGQDGIDYFLFEERQGYCNYYASSMAIMLRHLGIPARLSVGYATGEQQPQTGLYRLRNNDAHVWVEVYFPKYGWIEFEPTAAEPALARPSGEIEFGDDEGGLSGRGVNPDEEEGNVPIDEETLGEGEAPLAPTTTTLLAGTGGRLLLVAAVLGILLIAIWSARRLGRPQGQRKRPVFRTVPQGFSVRLWEKLMHWARRFGLGQRPSLTPLEQAAIFAHAVPDAAAGIDSIAQLYAEDTYSPHDISPDQASDAQLSWLTIRPIFWRYWLRQRLHLPAGLKRSLFVQDE